MKNVLKYLFLTLLLTVSSPLFAQDAEMADVMRSNGKIYVVLGIALIVLFGLIAYVISIDRKATRIEKKLPGNKA